MGTKVGKFYVDIMSMHPEVTGSCILCVLRVPSKDKRIKFIIDFGMFQEEEYSEYNKKVLFDAGELDFACITHAHVDHIGRLPLLAVKGFRGNVYCSSQTSEVLPHSLYDCWKVTKETSKRKHEKPLYEEKDVDAILKTIKPCDFNRTVQVNEFIKVTFFKNGHLYGASLILVQIDCFGEGQINLLFSGDYSSQNMFFDVEKLPEWVKQIPLNVVIESTYGYMTTAEMEPCFESNLLSALKCGEDVVIPAFSLGRGQEILFILKQLQVAGKIRPEVEILYCGKLGIRYTKDIYMDNETFLPDARNFIPENVTFIDKSNKEEVYSDKRQKIIIGSSGMGTYGPMQTIIPFFLKRNALIHFTGYCAEGTLGRKLMTAEAGSTIELSNMVIKKRAEVKFTKEFSAHAKSDELLEFLAQFCQVNTVLINHGTFESKRLFAEKVQEEINTNQVAILSREIGFRINPFGLQKPLNTKFI